MKKHPLWCLGEHTLGHFILTLGTSHFTISAYQTQSTKNAYNSKDLQLHKVKQVEVRTYLKFENRSRKFLSRCL